MEITDISGKIKEEYLKAKIDDLETSSKNNNTRDLYRYINYFNTRNNMVKDEKVICLQTAIVFWVGGGNIFLSY